MATAAPGAPGPGGVAPADAPWPALLGPYRLDRCLGRGSTASVHLAQDTRDGSWLAVKLLPADTGPDDTLQHELRARLQQEAAIAQQLRHPDIVGLLAAGQTAGRPWLAMELAPGCALQRYTHRARLLPEPVVLGIGSRLAQALAHAHGQGVVHRDIKPANVLVDLPSRSLKVTDFGTARVLDGLRTRTEVLLGSPSYMAPELLAGEPADEGSDLYALGVVLFELLTGRRPHEADTMGELLRRVSRDPAPELQRLRPDLPPPAARLLQALLAPQRAARPAGAAELSQSLHALGPPWQALPPPSGPEVPPAPAA
jgi:eukaryotic-like serine/threonine-protein kinase